ncbi:MAG: thioredoxin family protein [Chitinophagales bacterium]
MQKKLILTITFLLLFSISNFNLVIKAQSNSHIKRVKVAALNQNEVEAFRRNLSDKQDKDKKRKKRFRKRRKTTDKQPLFANRRGKTRKYSFKKRHKKTRPSKTSTTIAIEEVENVKKSTYIFDDNNFETSLIQNEGLVVVDFSAVWCAPCIILEPVIDDIAARYKGTALVGKVDIDQNPMIAKTYEVTQLPTILYIKNGKVVHRHIGSASHSQIETQIKQLL